jgi:hypothetical protein
MMEREERAALILAAYDAGNMTPGSARRESQSSGVSLEE